MPFGGAVIGMLVPEPLIVGARIVEGMQKARGRGVDGRSGRYFPLTSSPPRREFSFAGFLTPARAGGTPRELQLLPNIGPSGPRWQE